jgi:hypothetical protein
MTRSVLYFLFTSFLLSNCKKDADIDITQRPFTRDFYVQGNFKDYDTTGYIPLDITVGKRVEPVFSNLISCTSTASVINGYRGIRLDFWGIGNSDPLMYFDFKSSLPKEPSLPEKLSLAEVEAFFPKGKSFPTNGGAGNVAIGYQVVMPDFFFYKEYALSNDSIGPLPIGSLTILDTEDYSYQGNNFFTGQLINFTGKKIRCKFDTWLHRPIDFEQTNNVNHSVYEPAQITNGEVSFFVQYF